jgi:hypothetical protein
MTLAPPQKPSDDAARTEQAKRVIEEYVADLREILRQLARHLMN